MDINSNYHAGNNVPLSHRCSLALSPTKHPLDTPNIDSQRQTTRNNRDTAQRHGQSSPNRTEAPVFIHSDDLSTNDLLVMPTDDGVENTCSNRYKTKIVDHCPAEIHSHTIEYASAEEDELEDCGEI